ncbi:MAG TPA: accessory gene regulator B family protein [Clostridiaceae bacterium]|jgi:accessory gene regulator B|nr:accessory gene regulator B family protein [Clostridiaceae bacterium]
MLQKFSEQFTDFLLMKGIIESENREIYTYGFVALFSTAINTIIVLTIGIIAGIILESIFFVLMFGILRVYCGGYHAETHISCVLIFIGIYIAAMAIARLLPIEAQSVFSVFAGIISFFLIFLLAPIEHKNKPFIDDEEIKFRRMSRIIASVELMSILIITAFFSRAIGAAVLMSLAMLGVTFILILAKAAEKRG